jgi:hypothetical protein
MSRSSRVVPPPLVRFLLEGKVSVTLIPDRPGPSMASALGLLSDPSHDDMTFELAPPAKEAYLSLGPGQHFLARDHPRLAHAAYTVQVDSDNVSLRPGLKVARPHFYHDQTSRRSWESDGTTPLAVATPRTDDVLMIPPQAEFLILPGSVYNATIFPSSDMGYSVDACHRIFYRSGPGRQDDGHAGDMDHVLR